MQCSVWAIFRAVSLRAARYDGLVFMAKISAARLHPPEDSDEQLTAFSDLIGPLAQDGHILGDGHRIIALENELALYAAIPAEDALEKSNWNSWVTQSIEKLASVGLGDLELSILGPLHEEWPACACTDRTYLILYTNLFEIAPPVKCGDCRCPVPLYRLPRMEHDSFYRVRGWDSDYKSCDSLWLNSSTGGRFGARELERIDSSLSRCGLELCAELEASTGKPVYFYLWHYYGRSSKQELARKCPKCGAEWLLAEPLHGLFDFRCDPCRLLSSIAADFRR